MVSVGLNPLIDGKVELPITTSPIHDPVGWGVRAAGLARNRGPPCGLPGAV